MLLLLTFVPGYYVDASRPPERPLRELYRALVPFRAAIEAPGTVIVTPGYGSELCGYLRDRPRHMCRSLDYYWLRAEAKTPGSLLAVLAAHGANMFYADENVTGEPEVRQGVAGAEAAGWESSCGGERSPVNECCCAGERPAPRRKPRSGRACDVCRFGPAACSEGSASSSWRTTPARRSRPCSTA